MFFKNNNEKKLSFAFGGYKFTIDEKYLKYQSAYGKSFRVPKSAIESVSLDEAGAGKNELKVNGNGTVLASVKLAKPWTEKAQDFIYDEIISKNKNQD